MRNLDNLLKNRIINNELLIKYGFNKENDNYVYNKIIKDKFNVNVIINDKMKIAKVIDLDMNDEYILVDTDAYGEFVGTIKNEYEDILNDIVNSCSMIDFSAKQTNKIVKYIKDKYNNNIEFLWEDDLDDGVWRCSDNLKWYAILMKTSKRKFGYQSDERIEILDLKYQKENIKDIIDNKMIYPGYHMNKNSWITIILDNRMKDEEIFKLIDNSYMLVSNNKKMDDLEKKVLYYLRVIPKGKVVTYKQVAEYLGNKGLARVVGNILHKNPDGDKYPCYKVLNSKGCLANEFVFGGFDEQKKRLEKEGIEVINNKVDLKKYQWDEKK